MKTNSSITKRKVSDATIKVQHINILYSLYTPTLIHGKTFKTWSSKRALIPMFFFLNELKNSSSVIGSVNASGPSSEIGGTETGCESSHTH